MKLSTSKKASWLYQISGMFAGVAGSHIALGNWDAVFVCLIPGFLCLVFADLAMDKVNRDSEVAKCQ